MDIRKQFIAGLLAGLAVIPLLDAAEPLPYGHKDFYPTTERPLAFMGDGDGFYSGATMPDWAALGSNVVVWAVPMESPGMAAPVVVGEKVFVLGDPWMLYCLNVHDGKEIWRRSLSPSLDMPPPLARNLEEEWRYYDAWETVRGQWILDMVETWRQVRAVASEDADLQLQSPRLITAGHPNEQVIVDKLLALGDGLGAKVKAVRETANSWGFHYHERENGGSVTEPWKVWRRRMSEAYNMHMFSSWYGYLTWTYMQPCTDGQYLYVPLAQNHMACVDLDGELRWLRWLPHDNPDIDAGTRFVKSPLLSSKYLIWRADGRLSVLDKLTGDLLWSAYPQGVTGWRPDPECGQPTLMQLKTASGQPLAVIVDPGTNAKVYRLEDGKELGAMPMHEQAYYFRRRFARGDMLISICRDRSGENEKKEVHMAVGWRVTAPDRDRIEFSEAWRRTEFNRLPAAWGEGVIAQPARGPKNELLNPLTGATLRENVHWEQIYAWPVVVGNEEMTWRTKDHDTFKDPQARRLHLAFRNLESGKQVGFPPLLDVTWAENPAWKRRWAGRSNMVFLSSAGVMPQANRYFFRTYGTAWCLGDPAQKFPVNEKWPAEARIGATQPRATPATVGPSEVVNALTTGSQDRWRAAIVTLAKPGTSLPGQQVAELVAAHARAKGPHRNALACALGVIGPKAAAAGPALAADVVEAENGVAINAGWALGRLGEAGKPALAAVQEWVKTYLQHPNDYWKGESRFKRFMAAGLAISGIEGQAAVEALLAERGINENAKRGLSYSLIVQSETPSDRPFPWPEQALAKPQNKP